MEQQASNSTSNILLSPCFTGEIVFDTGRQQREEKSVCSFASVDPSLCYIGRYCSYIFNFLVLNHIFHIFHRWIYDRSKTQSA